MFHKRPATPKAPWTVQLLTADYLIEGHMDGEDPVAPWFLHVQAEDLAMATLTLTQPNIQPTGNLSVTVPGSGKWVLPSTAVFVAVIPRDEGSTAYALKRNSSSNKPIGAVVLVGPYAIRGTILSPDDDLEILAGYETFAMQNAVIDCLAPGARLTGLAAPYVIVRTLLMQGIIVNA